MDIIVLRDSYRQVLTVPQEGALHLSDQLTITQSANGLVCQEGPQQHPLDTGRRFGELIVYPQPSDQHRYSIDGLSRVVIGPQPGSDLLTGDWGLSLLLKREAAGSWQLQNLGAPIYLNNHLVTQKRLHL
ncbi:hypothetical protein ACFOSE_09640, partial [Streptococcus dentapri]